MGLFDMFRRKEVSLTRSALDEANSEGGNDDAVTQLILRLTSVGIDGAGPFTGAVKLSDQALKRESGNVDDAVKRVVGQHLRGGAAGGFVTSLGGFVTMVAALPANVFEFYVQATRMVGAIAAVRGYDLEDEEVRTRVLAALVGEESDDILASVGLGPVAGAATRQITKRLPASPSTAVARAIGGRVVRRFGLRSTRLFGKAIPGLGGVIGAWGDRRALEKIADTALKDFPQV